MNEAGFYTSKQRVYSRNTYHGGHDSVLTKNEQCFCLISTWVVYKR